MPVGGMLESLKSPRSPRQYAWIASTAWARSSSRAGFMPSPRAALLPVASVPITRPPVKALSVASWFPTTTGWRATTWLTIGPTRTEGAARATSSWCR